MNYFNKSNDIISITPLTHSFFLKKKINHLQHDLVELCEYNINSLEYTDMKDSLLGEIKNGSQIKLEKYDFKIYDTLINEINECSKAFISTYREAIQNSDFEANIGVSKIWIVNQKKTDYNPIHNHENDQSDYGLSGFIHIKIPDNVTNKTHLNQINEKEELICSNFRGSKGCNDGVTSFIWKRIGTQIDKKSFIFPGIYDCPLETGILYLFPSWLDHMVNPFFDTEDSRITIAFNVHVIWNKI